MVFMLFSCQHKLLLWFNLLMGFFIFCTFSWEHQAILDLLQGPLAGFKLDTLVAGATSKDSADS